MKLIAKGDRKVLDICSTFDKTDATPKETGKPGVGLFITAYGLYYERFYPISRQLNMKCMRVYVCIKYSKKIHNI